MMYPTTPTSAVVPIILLIALTFARDAMADVTPFTDRKAYDALVGAYDGLASQTFKSSTIRAPVFQVNHWDLNRADDSKHIFIGSVYGDGKAGPMILDARDLSLVYADQRYDNTYHSDVQPIKGKPYYFFWEGAHSRGHANGNCLFFDETYNLVYNVTAKKSPGVMADMHDVRVTHDDHVLFTTYFNIPWNTTELGGEEGSLIMDSGFQEVDITTNEVLFDWAASDHFNITDSMASYTEAYGVSPDSGFDFAHVNSVEKTPEGDYLVSMRHLSALALVSGQDGHLIWVLGGKLNQFTDLSSGKATDFSWQHDARFHFGNVSQITLFDNHGEQTNHCPSKESPVCDTRSLHLELDYETMAAKVLQEYWHPDGINSGAMGGLTPLKNGNVFLAWGYNPSYTEFTPDGSIVLSFNRGKVPGQLNDMFAYRAMKGNWIGRPLWAPSIAVSRTAETTDNATVYLSWNGATEVASWALYASNDQENVLKRWNKAVDATRNGFETVVNLGKDTKGHRYLVAAAHDALGRILGSTDVVDTLDGTRVAGGRTFTLTEAHHFAAADSMEIETAAVVFMVGMALYYGVIAWTEKTVAKDLEQGFKPVKLR